MEDPSTPGAWLSKQGAPASESTLTTYTETGLSEGDTRTFRLTAYNIHGAGTTSSTVDLVASSVPAAPNAPTVTLSNSFARIAFTDNGDGGETIDAYRIKVR